MNKLFGKYKKQEVLAAGFFLAPDVIGLLFIYVIPIIFVLYLSFHSWTGFDSIKFIGLNNYLVLFKDPLWLKSLRVTFFYVLLYVPIVTLGSLGLAVLVNTNLPEIKLFRTVYFLPIVMPLVVAAIVWEFIYMPSYGFLNYIFDIFGLSKHAFLGSENEALISVIIVSTWRQLGYYMVIYLAGLKDIPKMYYDASKVDGANPLKQFIHVTLPMLKPVITFVVVVNLIFALQDFDPVYVLTKGGPNYATYLQTYYIYEKGFRFLKMGLASSASIILLIIILTGSLAQLKIFRGGEYE